MKTPKNIPHPNLRNAEKLSPLQLNEIKIDEKHTVLTPQLLEEMASKNKTASN